MYEIAFFLSCAFSDVTFEVLFWDDSVNKHFSLKS